MAGDHEYFCYNCGAWYMPGDGHGCAQKNNTPPGKRAEKLAEKYANNNFRNSLSPFGDDIFKAFLGGYSARDLEVAELVNKLETYIDHESYQNFDALKLALAKLKEGAE